MTVYERLCELAELAEKEAQASTTSNAEKVIKSRGVGIDISAMSTDELADYYNINRDDLARAISKAKELRL